MKFVFRRARQNDFSFVGVSTRLEQMFENIWQTSLSEEQWEKGQELMAEFEQRRQRSMIEYAEAKRLQTQG